MKNIITSLLFILCIGSAHGFTVFGKSEVTEYWSQSDELSNQNVDHADWDQLLGRYVRDEQGINLFSYGEVSVEDAKRLSDYIAYLEGLNVTALNRQQQFAYWVNLYNAQTIKVILENYPTDSILDLSYSLLSRGPWKEEFLVVEQKALSLDDIEHKILRPIFKDERIHYAVNCASMSCPNLQPVAFTSENLEQLLDLGARQYINHPRGVTIDQGDILASSIFDWYGDDFGESEQEIIQHFIEYAEPELAKMLQGIDEIAEFDYDWSLNE